MGSRLPGTALRCSVVALAIAVSVLALSGVAGAREATSVPKEIVGGWSRNVTATNYSQHGVAPGYAVGAWTILVTSNGVVYVYTGRGYPPHCNACVADFTTRLTVAGPRLTVAPIPVCSTPGAYGWKTSGRSLTLTPIADKHCGPREALFTGVWKRI
jgi:hypothetical protein